MEFFSDENAKSGEFTTKGCFHEIDIILLTKIYDPIGVILFWCYQE